MLSRAEHSERKSGQRLEGFGYLEPRRGNKLTNWSNQLPIYGNRRRALAVLFLFFSFFFFFSTASRRSSRVS